MSAGLRTPVVFLAGTALCLTTFLAAQDRPPARDAARKPELVGTAVISGTLVTDDSSARPIAGRPSICPAAIFCGRARP